MLFEQQIYIKKNRRISHVEMANMQLKEDGMHVCFGGGGGGGGGE